MNRSGSILGRLQRKRLLVKSRRRGMHKGLRQSNSFGSSLEFSDFRLYQPGDDVRQIDWNIYGRTQKHYIKRFLDEQEVSVAIYLDCTSSMRTHALKWELAKQLAAALSYIVLHSEDRLLFFPVTAKMMLPVRRKGSVYGKAVFYDIIKLTEQEKSGGFAEKIEPFLPKNIQLAILISDGLEAIEQLEDIFKKMRSFKQEIWFLQVLSTEEIEPSLSNDLQLIDSETDAVVNVSMNKAIIAEYEKRMRNHNEKLELLCRRYGGHYMLVTDERELKTILLHDLPAKGLMN